MICRTLLPDPKSLIPSHQSLSKAKKLNPWVQLFDCTAFYHARRVISASPSFLTIFSIH